MGDVVEASTGAVVGAGEITDGATAAVAGEFCECAMRGAQSSPLTTIAKATRAAVVTRVADMIEPFPSKFLLQDRH